MFQIHSGRMMCRDGVKRYYDIRRFRFLFRCTDKPSSLVVWDAVDLAFSLADDNKNIGEEAAHSFSDKTQVLAESVGMPCRTTRIRYFLLGSYRPHRGYDRGGLGRES